MRGRNVTIAAAAALLASAPALAAAQQRAPDATAPRDGRGSQQGRDEDSVRATDDDEVRPDRTAADDGGPANAAADGSDGAGDGDSAETARPSKGSGRANANARANAKKKGKNKKRRERAQSAADRKIPNLVVEVPFEPDATAPDDVGRKRLDAAATWVQKKPKRRLILLSRPDNDEQPPEIAAERANRSIAYLRERGVTDDQLDNASSSLLTRFEPSTEREVRYVTLLQRRFDDATRAERKEKRRERRELRRQQQQGDGDWTDRDYALFVGGGALGYLYSDTRDAISPGASWDITLLARANQRLATEVTYVGAAAPLDRDMSPTLVSSLLEGAFRLQTRRYGGIARAYGLAGVGFGLVIADGETPGKEAYETVAHMPLGGGIEFAYDTVRLDLRAIARLTALDDFQVVDEAESENGLNLDNFQVSARLGWQF